MSEVIDYDAIVIGAGQGGGPLAGALAQEGWRTALVERKHVGGTCVNEGCTPTKTMIASARVAHLARRAADYGVDIGPVSVDMETVRQRKRQIVKQFRAGSRSSIESTDGLDLIESEAAFVGDKMLEVADTGGSRRLRGDHVVINTGERPFIPPIDGLEAVAYHDSTSIMELGVVPDHLIVLGGGYVGLEFAQMFRRFGSDVTIVQRGDQVLKHESPDVADGVVDVLRGDGIDVKLQTEATAARQEDTDGTITLIVEGQHGRDTLAGSHLLVATGRRPNTEALNLGAAGVKTGSRGYVQVNGRLETTAEGVYAIGDVKGGPAFTHISYDDYRILKDNLLNGSARTVGARIVPYTVFIDPQLGRVGLTEEQALEEGRDIKVARLPMTRVARALETDETRGFMKAVVDAASDQILGAAVLGPEGGEITSVLQMAMMGGVPYTRIRDTVFSHPTFAESLNNLFMTLD